MICLERGEGNNQQLVSSVGRKTRRADRVASREDFSRAGFEPLSTVAIVARDFDGIK
jgi:TATA-binding protein-associated factor Taf7